METLWKWQLWGLFGSHIGTLAQVGSLIHLGHRDGRRQFRIWIYPPICLPRFLKILPQNKSWVRVLGRPPPQWSQGLLFSLRFTNKHHNLRGLCPPNRRVVGAQACAASRRGGPRGAPPGMEDRSAGRMNARKPTWRMGTQRQGRKRHFKSSFIEVWKT